jgi:hypothetical protein
MIAKGGSALISKDLIKIMQILVDIEMKSFTGLDIKVIFLQNIISDLLLGLNADIFFIEFADYIRKKYKVLPGFLTMNLPLLLTRFEEWGIEETVICSSINNIGYLMSPGVAEYKKILSSYDRNKYQIMAMSIFASGAINPKEAVQFIGEQKIESVVFGASSQKNVQHSNELLKKYC